MTDAQTSWFNTAVTALSDPQNQRVWSIIVSLFGDLAQRDGDKISGRALTHIITPMGIKPEAIRVALHRLRKDGWIDSTRSGRASVHFLTASGRSQSAAVTPRIYAPTTITPQDWHLLIAEDGNSGTLDALVQQPNYVAVNRTTVLGHGPLPRGRSDLLVVTKPELSAPDWLRGRLFPEDLKLACARLDSTLNGLQLPKATVKPGLGPVQIATLRTLVVHRWRRVVLRHPDLPAAYHPSDWVGERCRHRVADLLQNLPRPVLTQTGDLLSANSD
ncbi:PaaX family transcriptional regulator C-terminal domain-containing protein [Phaeobacter porticola]|uniref:Putative phenylacetic acid degradation operon negative regulatory protein n=1 Tax=Phaeobacter porticola TaxID=1844006 RepID=A0A1L3I7I4_9RHOB|nr:PaaX family transcriptional regulator C-terminal domain-containing protein [Phaeobacter porticola]APG48007.1 putative phenylacetic acid degradation operon negative regulatory protein [Phaeobacter porticola]